MPGLAFGAAVALAADTLASGIPVAVALVGADPDTQQQGGGHPSEANLFVRTMASGEPVWIRQATFRTGAQGADAADWFGHAVAFAPTESGLLALVGAYYSNAAQEQGYPGGLAAGAVFVYDTSIIVAEDPEAAPVPPAEISLSVQPNPVRARARIEVRLPVAEHVRLTLYDLLGRRVLELFSGELPEGPHSFQLDASGLSPGAYAVRLESSQPPQAAILTVVR